MFPKLRNLFGQALPTISKKQKPYSVTNVTEWRKKFQEKVAILKKVSYISICAIES
jgi:hypothetical protein